MPLLYFNLMLPVRGKIKRSPQHMSVSYAKFHSLAFGASRHETHGVPLQPAMIAKEQGHLTPLL